MQVERSAQIVGKRKEAITLEAQLKTKRMGTRSCKAKGRRLCAEVRNALIEAFPDKLQPVDILVPATSVPGPDLYLSPRARELLNMQFECKNQERLNIHAATDQAQVHCKGGEIPILCYRRNREEAKIVIPLTAFISLLKDAKRSKHETDL
jgi:hypothetical protein